jgi:uncharacterized protein YcbK (DUF882 family)
MSTDRRQFMIGALGGVAGLSALSRGNGALASEAHALSLYHLHTAETLQVVYRERGELIPYKLDEINYFLRDFRNERMHVIDVALLDELCKLHAAFDWRGRFEVISGYRSRETNEALRHVSTGVAKDSLHVSGRAIDIRLTSAKTDKLRDAAIALRSGGVGYYPESNFVHVDTGAFRTW